MNKIFLKLIKNNNKLKRSLISLIVLNLTLFIILFINFYINNYFDTKIKNNINNRTLAFSNDVSDIASLEKIEGIEKIYKSALLPITYQNKSIYVNNIYAFDKKLISGSKELKDNQIIISSTLLENLDDKNTITINNVTLDIVGVCEDNEYDIYINDNSIDSIVDKSIYILIVDDYDNIPIVQEKVKPFNIEPNILNDSGMREVQKYITIFNIFKVLMVSIIVILMLINYIFITDIFKIYQKQIALLKTFGYKDYIIAFYILAIIAILYLVNNLIFSIFIPFSNLILKALLYLIIIDAFLLIINYISLILSFKKVAVIKLLKDK